jgi:hypothetical protein
MGYQVGDFVVVLDAPDEAEWFGEQGEYPGRIVSLLEQSITPGWSTWNVQFFKPSSHQAPICECFFKQFTFTPIEGMSLADIVSELAETNTYFLSGPISRWNELPQAERNAYAKREIELYAAAYNHDPMFNLAFASCIVRDVFHATNEQRNSEQYKYTFEWVQKNMA